MVNDGIMMSKEDYETLYQFRSIVETILDERTEQGIPRVKIMAELETYFPYNMQWVVIIADEYDKGIRLTEKK